MIDRVRHGWITADSLSVALGIKQTWVPPCSGPFADPHRKAVIMDAVVFSLWYEREYETREDTELHIGIFSSEASARAAIERLSSQIGFRDFPDGFNIYPMRLDQCGWTEGFISISESEMIDDGCEPLNKRRDMQDLPPRWSK